MKITFICDTMDSGGAERVISSLANSFTNFGHEVSIIMLAKRANCSFYKLSNKINLLGLTNNLSKEPSRFKKTSLLKKQILELKPDVVISFLSYVCIYTWLALKSTKIPYFVSERNDPNSRGKVKQFLLNRAFKKAAGCVFQTEDAKAWYKNISEEKSAVIYNPVNLTYVPKTLTERKKQVLYVGRFSEQKNCKLLVESFLKFHELHKDFSLKMHGDGPKKDEILKQITNANATSYIEVLNSSKTWQMDECDSSMFVLTSKFEGMPNVLAEALCLGIPSVSTNCSIGGPKELKKIFPGLLTLCDKQDPNEIAKSMEEALSVNPMISKIPDKLGKDYIAKQWIDFIEGIIKRK